MFPPMNVTRNPIFSFPSRKDKKKRKKKEKASNLHIGEAETGDFWILFLENHLKRLTDLWYVLLIVFSNWLMTNSFSSSQINLSHPKKPNWLIASSLSSGARAS